VPNANPAFRSSLVVASAAEHCSLQGAAGEIARVAALDGLAFAAGAGDNARVAQPQPTPEADPHAPPPLRGGLILGAISVVFGDIGTSPLYTLQECLTGRHGADPTPENVLGVVSLIAWSLTLVVTIKYLAFLMRADNEGEGGIMALLALVPERLRSPAAGRVGAVALLVIIGAALLFGDGIITPAISVLSAVEGLGVATSRLEPAVVPTTVAILFLLFYVQRRGTGGLGKAFGPIMIAWFVTIGALGAVRLAAHPQALAALSPVHAVRFFAANGWRGFRVLGGVVLGVTGGEALYADMGHFGRRPIRVAWLGLIYPCLLLCYLGQGALLVGDRHLVTQPFYALVPPGSWIYAMVALAAAATVIASQALISGVFSLTHQAIRLGYFPRLTVHHTSDEAEGQIYLPLINWGLMASCIALVLIFRQSSKLAAAFGLAVSGTMLITSIVYFVVIRSTWKWPLGRSLALLLLFLSFDLPFLAANSLKFFDGGYLPFLVGLFFVVIMVIWRIGRSLVTDYFRKRARPVDEFLADLDRKVVARVPGAAVFMSSVTTGIPAGLQQLVRRFRVLYEHNLLVHVMLEHVPHVPSKRRVEIEEIGPGLQRITLRYGFMDEPNVTREVGRALPRIGCPSKPEQLLYVLGRETYVGTSRNRMGAISESIFEVLNRNAKNATEYFRLPPEQVVELGMQIDL
jgi:KUP system potassium uptake protein